MVCCTVLQAEPETLEQADNCTDPATAPGALPLLLVQMLAARAAQSASKGGPQGHAVHAEGHAVHAVLDVVAYLEVAAVQTQAPHLGHSQASTLALVKTISGVFRIQALSMLKKIVHTRGED